MNILFHFFINILLVLPFKLSLFEILLVGIGGVLIDIDHILFMIFKKKLYSIKDMLKFHRINFKLMTPHFFIFHMVEIILLFMITSYFLNWHVFLISVGFALHYLMDIIKYLWVYKSFKPWISYFSIITYWLDIGEIK